MPKSNSAKSGGKAIIKISKAPNVPPNGQPVSEMDDFFKEFDADGDGYLDLNEMQVAYLAIKHKNGEQSKEGTDKDKEPEEDLSGLTPNERRLKLAKKYIVMFAVCCWASLKRFGRCSWWTGKKCCKFCRLMKRAAEETMEDSEIRELNPKPSEAAVVVLDNPPALPKNQPWQTSSKAMEIVEEPLPEELWKDGIFCTQPVKETKNKPLPKSPRKTNKKKKTSSGYGQKTKAEKTGNAIMERIESEILCASPGVYFMNVKGLAKVKQALWETIILPREKPEFFTGLRAPPRGLLLFGPPGNGKTMIAKAVATECKSTFFSISASSLVSKWVGESEQLVKALFTIAREKAPSIIFIDEVDSLLKSRGGGKEQEGSRRLKTEFLVQFDGVAATTSDENILVIGATNLPWELDEAVIRRFPKRFQVPLPDPETRFGLVKYLMLKTTCAIPGEAVKDIITKTKGYSGSDLTQLCKDAAMGPIREKGADIMNMTHAQLPPIGQHHFNDSLRNVRASCSGESLRTYNDWDMEFGSKLKAVDPNKNADKNFSNMFES